MRLVDPNIIKETLSVKKDNQGNETGYWHTYFPEKNNSPNKDLHQHVVQTN